MVSYVRITLPAEMADDLVEEQLAVRPIMTRGTSFADAISIAVDIVNTGSDIVTVVVAGATCQRIAKSIMQRRKPADKHQMTVTVTRDEKSQSLEVDLSEPEAEDRIVDFLLSSMT